MIALVIALACAATTAGADPVDDVVDGADDERHVVDRQRHDDVEDALGSSAPVVAAAPVVEGTPSWSSSPPAWVDPIAVGVAAGAAGLGVALVGVPLLGVNFGALMIVAFAAPAAVVVAGGITALIVDAGIRDVLIGDVIGFVVGAGVGVGAGFGIGTALDYPSRDCGDCKTDFAVGFAFIGAAVGAAVGTLTGGVVGAVHE